MKAMVTALVVLIVGLSSSLTNAEDVPGNSGGALYRDNCSVCHGRHAEGNIDFRVPVLAGYPSSYLLRQIGLFLTGQRTGEDETGRIKTMITTQNELSADELVQISMYLSELDIPVLKQDISSVGLRERDFYSRSCSGCHGADASGNEVQGSPRLTGQYDWYIKSQLAGFRAGHRGTHDGDKYGRQMKMMADAIATDADIDALANYLLTLDTN